MTQSRQAGGPLQVGDLAPDVELAVGAAAPLRLSSLRGRQAVVLFFYPQDGTPVCTTEACAFRDSFEDFSAAGATVIGVSADSSARHQQFADEHRLPFLLAADPDRVVHRAFGVRRRLLVLPGRETFVIDQQGKVRHIFRALLSGRRHMREALAIVQALHAESQRGPEAQAVERR